MNPNKTHTLCLMSSLGFRRHSIAVSALGDKPSLNHSDISGEIWKRLITLRSVRVQSPSILNRSGSITARWVCLRLISGAVGCCRLTLAQPPHPLCSENDANKQWSLTELRTWAHVTTPESGLAQCIYCVLHAMFQRLRLRWPGPETDFC